MEKTTIVVVLVIGAMSSRFWAMVLRIRKAYENNKEILGEISLFYGRVKLGYFITLQSKARKTRKITAHIYIHLRTNSQ